MPNGLDLWSPSTDGGQRVLAQDGQGIHEADCYLVQTCEQSTLHSVMTLKTASEYTPDMLASYSLP